MDGAPDFQRFTAPAIRPRLRVTPLELGVALMLLALAARIIGLDLRPLWLDEAYSAWFSSRGWHELWTVVPTYETHPPLYYSMLKLWRALFGGSAVALRSLSVLFGALTVPLVMAAALEIERQRPSGHPMLTAGAAGFLAACGPTLVQHGQEARPYAFMTFAYAMAILGLLKLMGEFQAGGAGRRSSWLILAGGTELTLWGHALGPPYALCIAAALAPAWLGGQPPRSRYLRGLTAASVTLLVYIPCFLLIAGRTGNWGSGWLKWSPDMLLKLLGLYAIPAEVLTIASAVAALIMILLTKRAIQAGFTRRWSAQSALLLLWWGPPLLTALISALYMPLFLVRTLTPTLVPCYLALAVALAHIASGKERIGLAVALGATMLPATVAMALRPVTEAWDQVDKLLERNVRPGDLVWLYPNDSALPLRDADPSATFPRRGIPGEYPALATPGPRRAGSPAVPSITRESAEQLAADPSLLNVRTIWLVTAHGDYFDPDGDLRRALTRTRVAGPRAVWDYIEVRPYAERSGGR